MTAVFCVPSPHDLREVFRLLNGWGRDVTAGMACSKTVPAVNLRLGLIQTANASGLWHPLLHGSPRRFSAVGAEG